MNFLDKISRNSFFKNVSTLAIGTVVSQIIVIGFSPLLTRIYTVESFGVLALFTSFTVIFGVITTGRYELSIGLPLDQEKAKNLVKLISITGFVISILYLFIIIIIKETHTLITLFPIFSKKWIYLAPVYTFFIALYSALIYWNQRNKNYKKITLSNALQVISATIFSIIFGLLGIIEIGMIISLILGIICSTFFLIKNATKDDCIFEFDAIKNVAKEYISFPKFMILSDLSLTISQQYIPIIFAELFNATIVGYFALANRMIRLPNIVLTSSVANVFRNDAIDSIRNKGNCQQLYISTIKKLIYISLPIFILIFIFSPFLFTIFFGKKWEVAGNFARILSVMLLFEFVAIPLNSLFYIFERQKKLMNLQILNTIFGFLSIYIGFKFYNNSSVSLLLFCLNSIIFNLIFIFFTYNFSKQIKHNVV